MKGRCLADQGDRLRAGRHQRGEPLVLGNAGSLAPRHAEGRNPGVAEPLAGDPLKILGVPRVRGGIAPFDIIEAEAVQPSRQQQLVFQ